MRSMAGHLRGMRLQGDSLPAHPTGPEEKEGLYFSELWERAQEQQSEQVKNTGELTWLTIH